MKLYDQLSDWWQLLSPASDYAEEAEYYGQQLLAVGDSPATTMLELGSGGGNNASFLRKRFEMTLVDLAPGMLAMSRELNPECEHVQGDMRTVRLGRQFDRVFVHDAVVYMTTREDLLAAMETAFVHCRPGGAALFAPDHVRENFRPHSAHDGHDAPDGRGLRYVEWVWDPDPSDNTYLVDYAYLLRERDGSVRVEHDRHLEGLFARAEWVELLAKVGFTPRVLSVPHSDLEPDSYEVFVGVR